MADNYDSPWKRALKRNLADFIAFYFRHYCGMIDWDQPLHLRDKELDESRRDGRPRTLIADMLASAFLRDGREVAERILDYNYCLYKGYRLPVASLVVLADAGRRWRQDSFYNDVLARTTNSWEAPSALCREVAAYQASVRAWVAQAAYYRFVPDDSLADAFACRAGEAVNAQHQAA